jgi:hypothetical protein
MSLLPPGLFGTDGTAARSALGLAAIVTSGNYGDLLNKRAAMDGAEKAIRK